MEEEKQEVIQVRLRDSLSSYLTAEFRKAVEAKKQIEQEMIEALRARRCEYSPEKLASMRSLFGADYNPPYVPITLTKCISAEAWLKDIILNSNEIPFTIKPTPVPDIEDSEVNHLINTVTNNITQKVMEGKYGDVEFAKTDSEKQFLGLLQAKKQELAEKYADSITLKINDQLIEGGWYEALDKFISDLSTFHCGFIKGPIFNSKKRIKRTQNGFTIQTDIIPVFKHVSPFDIYPEPDSSDIDDGYLFERIFFNKNDLYMFYDLDDVNLEELEAVFLELLNTGHSEDLAIDQEKKELENKDISYESNKIEGLEFWGYVQGSMLIDWGMKDQDIDSTKPYFINAIIIKDRVIRAKIDPNPMHKKPYFKESFMRVNGSFWGIGIPAILKDIQAICNSVARSIVLNSAYASGPIAEVNEDKLANGVSPYIHPHKLYIVSNTQMSESPVVRFNVPPLVADRLINVYNHFSRIADEISVPSYVYGDTDIGGAGRTLGGLRLLYAGASRNIKNVVRNIDINVIEPSIELLYSYNIIYNILEDLPDSQIVAKGSSYLMVKEQQINEIIELLGLTMNPVDSQYINRKKLIETIIRGKGLNVTDVLLDTDIVSQLQTQRGGLNLDAMKQGSPIAYNAMTGGSLPNLDKDKDRIPTE